MKNYMQLFRNMECALALEAIMEFAGACNKYVDSQAPWALHKEGKQDRLETVMAVLLASLRKIALCAWPVMPDAASLMLRQLGDARASADIPPCSSLEEEAETFANLPQNLVLAESSNIFPRIEQVKNAEKSERKPSKKAAETGLKIEAYNALGITCGRIVKASRHPNADKILCLEIDFAEDAPRQILSGLAEYFKPEELAGRMICAVLNLAPRSIRGLTSNGMVLTAETENGLALVDPGQDTLPGTPVA